MRGPGASGDRWVVLLRGLNVGRANRLTMVQLRDALSEAGCPGARTYLQSGNAVVDAIPDTPPDEAAARIARTVAARTGSEVGVRVLDRDALQRTVDGNPFPAAEEQPTRLHLFFLSGVPAADAASRLDGIATPTERFELRGGLLYLHAPDGIGRSKLAASVERRLGVEATARNWRTVTALAKLVRTDDDPAESGAAGGGVSRER